MLVTNAPSTANVNVMQQHTPARHIVHILHYIPEARSKDVDVIEEILPIYDTAVALKLKSKPTKTYLAPSGTVLEAE